MISNNGIKKTPEYVDKVRNAKRPETVKEMRRFLGLVNFQRKFVPNCSLMTKCLSNWTVGNKSKKVVWTEEMEARFQELKEEIAKDVMLAYPDYSKTARKIELYVDASETGCGACLMQMQGDKKQVIAYNSMTFSVTQARYSTTDRELTAIRWGINTFRGFLAGASFILYTDHNPLVFLHNMSAVNSRIMRTLMELAEFDFEVRYRPGTSNEAADFLSRLSEPKKEEIEGIDAKFLPKELKMICEVSGGGDSTMEAW